MWASTVSRDGMDDNKEAELVFFVPRKKANCDPGMDELFMQVGNMESTEPGPGIDTNGSELMFPVPQKEAEANHTPESFDMIPDPGLEALLMQLGTVESREPGPGFDMNGSELMVSISRKEAEDNRSPERFQGVPDTHEMEKLSQYPDIVIAIEETVDPCDKTLSIHNKKIDESWDELILPHNEMNENKQNLLSCNQPSSSFSTSMCSFSTMNKTKFKNHQQNHEINNNVAYECTFCFRKFETKSGAHDHMRRVHEAPSEINNLCQFCGVFFRNCSKKKHICKDSKSKKKSNEIDETYECEHCDYKSQIKSHINRHVKSVHDKNLFYCNMSDSCTYKCSRKDNLLRHENSHKLSLKNKKYIKPVKKMKSKFNVENSKNIYKICYICGDSVLNQNSHFLKVHKRSSFVCETCHKPLSSKQMLENHVKVKHQTKSEYVCPFCKQTFKDSPTCKRHLNIHTFDDSKLKQCPHCSYKTKYNFHLKKHVKIHENKLMKCNICGLCFKNDSSLRKHAKRNH